jgi:hypothetical protein
MPSEYPRTGAPRVAGKRILGSAKKKLLQCRPDDKENSAAIPRFFPIKQSFTI